MSHDNRRDTLMTGPNPHEIELATNLTETQAEVFVMDSNGLSPGEIANELKTSRSNVYNIRADVRRKVEEAEVLTNFARELGQ